MTRTLHHLMVIDDGEVQDNALFTTSRARAEHLIESIKNGSLGDSEEFQDLIDEQDEEAMQADYPEGTSPSLPEPEDRVDGIRDWLSEKGVDIYLESLSVPEGVNAS